jgi:hypothetical protein
VRRGHGATRARTDCSGPDHWAAIMTIVKLKSAGILTQEAFSARVESRQILSRRLPNGRYRQIFRVVIPRRGGPPVVALTVSDATFEECSMDDPKVYLVSREL